MSKVEQVQKLCPSCGIRFLSFSRVGATESVHLFIGFATPKGSCVVEVVLRGLDHRPDKRSDCEDVGLFTVRSVVKTKDSHQSRTLMMLDICTNRGHPWSCITRNSGILIFTAVDYHFCYSDLCNTNTL